MSDSHVKCPRCGGMGYLTAATTRVGDLIAARRLKLDMTQLDLAQLVGISRAQIANIEGGRTDPMLRDLRKYADALQCEPKELIP